MAPSTRRINRIPPTTHQSAEPLNEIPGLSSGVIGFKASGKLKAEDFRDTPGPCTGKAAADADVRIVIVMPTFASGHLGGHETGNQELERLEAQ